MYANPRSFGHSKLCGSTRFVFVSLLRSVQQPVSRLRSFYFLFLRFPRFPFPAHYVPYACPAPLGSGLSSAPSLTSRRLSHLPLVVFHTCHSAICLPGFAVSRFLFPACPPDIVSIVSGLFYSVLYSLNRRLAHSLRSETHTDQTLAIFTTCPFSSLYCRIADHNELQVPGQCKLEFDDPDDLMNFRMVLTPNEVRV